jgi:hypothetical protein
MEPLKQENKVNKLLPPGFFIDKQEDEKWDEKDIAKLQREGFLRNQARTSGQPKDSEK